MIAEIIHGNTRYIAYIMIWVCNIIFLLAYLPQIKLNHKLRTATGCSGMMLVGAHFGYLLQIFYIFCFGLPLAYKFCFPLGLLIINIIIFQRLYFDGIHGNKLLVVICLFGIIAALSFIPFAQIHPKIVGNTMGSIAIIIWSLYQLPQVYKMYVAKSAQGFSFLFVSIAFFGVSVELVSALILNFPIVAILNITRSVIGYIIFFIQFLIFYHSST